MKKKDEIQARLTVYGMNEMSLKQFRFYRNWIRAIYEEMKTADRKDYSKVWRATLYKI